MMCYPLLCNTIAVCVELRSLKSIEGAEILEQNQLKKHQKTNLFDCASVPLISETRVEVRTVTTSLSQFWAYSNLTPI